MRTLPLGSSQLHATRIALGCMPFGGEWNTQPVTAEAKARAKNALRAAIDAGIRCFDHADIYCMGKSESAFGEVFRELGTRRQDVILQSKVGIRFGGEPEPTAPHRFDFSYEHIIRAAEGSLRRLGTDYLDIYLLHRPDALVEPEEVARAFDDLQQQGKVLHFGVSNHAPAQIDLLRRYLRQPLVVNQLEFNLVHTALIDAAIVANQRVPSLGADGILDYCRLNNITVQAWAPLAQGRALGGNGDPKAAELARVVTTLARAKEVPPEAIAIAWLLRHPAGIQPVLGSADPVRIAAACAAENVTLSREEWYMLYVAGRGEKLP